MAYAELIIDWYKEYQLDNGERHVICRRSTMDIRQGYLGSTESFNQFLEETIRDYNDLGKRVFNIQIHSYDLEKYLKKIKFIPEEDINPDDLKDLRPLNEDMI